MCAAHDAKWMHSDVVQHFNVSPDDSIALAQCIPHLMWLSETRVRKHQRGCDFTGNNCLTRDWTSNRHDVFFDMQLGSFVCLNHISGAHGFFDIGDMLQVFRNNTWIHLEEMHIPDPTFIDVWLINTVDVKKGFIVKRAARRFTKCTKAITAKRIHERLTNWMMRIGIILANNWKGTVRRTT